MVSEDDAARNWLNCALRMANARKESTGIDHEHNRRVGVERRPTAVASGAQANYDRPHQHEGEHKRGRVHVRVAPHLFVNVVSVAC